MKFIWGNEKGDEKGVEAEKERGWKERREKVGKRPAGNTWLGEGPGEEKEVGAANSPFIASQAPNWLLLSNCWEEPRRNANLESPSSACCALVPGR